MSFILVIHVFLCSTFFSQKTHSLSILSLKPLNSLCSHYIIGAPSCLYSCFTYSSINEFFSCSLSTSSSASIRFPCSTCPIYPLTCFCSLSYWYFFYTCLPSFYLQFFWCPNLTEVTSLILSTLASCHIISLILL